ncbi:MAG TPA: hypothetical protein VMV56_03440, partial [Williamwhitmania sp.]|nr:hypothetical protein [Williamwhitmania sp.]
MICIPAVGINSNGTINLAMPLYQPEMIALSGKAHRLLKQLVLENPRVKDIYSAANNDDEAKVLLQSWAMEILVENPIALQYYKNEKTGRKAFEQLRWKDFAAIRILDYIDNAGRVFENPYRKSIISISDPFKILWWAIKQNGGGAKSQFFHDLIFLFRQLTQQLPPTKPSTEKVLKWMDRWNDGLDEELVGIRRKNKSRIIDLLIKKMDCGELTDTKYTFPPGCSQVEKVALVNSWWDEHLFHLRFAIRSPHLMNEMLNHSLDTDTMNLMESAEKKGIPFFVNPYYLSLLNATPNAHHANSDLAIRHYVIYSKQLIEEFGRIEAWEKEDTVELGKPNAAGWLLPSTHSIHRRYPEVAILIPETMGRACGGLCSSCQRMYDFQRGNLNFNLEKLTPKEKWEDKLMRHLTYYETDTQLRDILITGGDALMSRNASLERILEAVYQMAWRKKE